MITHTHTHSHTHTHMQCKQRFDKLSRSESSACQTARRREVVHFSQASTYSSTKLLQPPRLRLSVINRHGGSTSPLFSPFSPLIVEFSASVTTCQTFSLNSVVSFFPLTFLSPSVNQRNSTKTPFILIIPLYFSALLFLRVDFQRPGLRVCESRPASVCDLVWEDVCLPVPLSARL